MKWVVHIVGEWLGTFTAELRGKVNGLMDIGEVLSYGVTSKCLSNITAEMFGALPQLNGSAGEWVSEWFSDVTAK